MMSVWLSPPPGLKCLRLLDQSGWNLTHVMATDKRAVLALKFNLISLLHERERERDSTPSYRGFKKTGGKVSQALIVHFCFAGAC